MKGVSFACITHYIYMSDISEDDFLVYKNYG